MTAWQKRGLIFRPDPSRWWMKTHAALPVPVPLEGSLYRVFFSSRDDRNRSHVGYFDFDLRDLKVVDDSTDPVLAPGPLGHFDDHGIYAASAVRDGGRILLYTIGWNPGQRAPLFYTSIGLAESTDNGRSFHKRGRAPILSRSEFDPCLVSAPFVLRESSVWRMWYLSGIAWELEGEKPHSVYHIKYAESDDGVFWKREGVVAIDFAHPRERNIARTCVLKRGRLYHGWFSYDRGFGYRIGHATSRDGIAWDRQRDPEGLEPSPTGWDSEAAAYPYVVAHDGRLYMFYNGNRFGRDGIGLAVCEEQRS